MWGVNILPWSLQQGMVVALVECAFTIQAVLVSLSNSALLLSLWRKLVPLVLEVYKGQSRFYETVSHRRVVIAEWYLKSRRNPKLSHIAEWYLKSRRKTGTPSAFTIQAVLVSFSNSSLLLSLWRKLVPLVLEVYKGQRRFYETVSHRWVVLEVAKENRYP